VAGSSSTGGSKAIAAAAAAAVSSSAAAASAAASDSSSSAAQQQQVIVPWTAPRSLYTDAVKRRHPPPHKHSYTVREAPVAIAELDAAYDALQPVDPASSTPVRPIRVCCISDTHQYEQCLTLPKCDLLIHAGDWLMTSGMNIAAINNRYIKNVLGWWARQQPSAVKVFCAGNHDHGLEHILETDEPEFMKLCGNSYFLRGDEIVEVFGGLTIRGSSWSTSTGSSNKAFQNADQWLAPLARPPRRVVRFVRSQTGEPAPVVASAATSASSVNRVVDLLVTHCNLPRHKALMQAIDPAISLSGHYHAFHGVDRHGPGVVRKHAGKSDGDDSAFFTSHVTEINASIVASLQDPPTLAAPIVFDIVPSA
jgi:hypothetical protein